ncbi:MAG: hypothetical protein JNJ61_16090 [Anaerolineae bacterium]|nr:hypothetical protein [Anaerolineae bacterium]
MQPDLVAHWSAFARQSVPAGDGGFLAARSLSSGTLLVHAPADVDLTLPGIARCDDPEEANLSVVAHRGDATATAAQVEERMVLGERVAVWDARLPESADPALFDALLASTVYLGNLAAYDIDLTRLLLTAMIPVRDGTAFRRYLATNMLYWWAWRAVVQAEIERRFGATIPPEAQARAVTQARSRLGAHLYKMGRRGLRFRVDDVEFPGGELAAMRFDLYPA